MTLSSGSEAGINTRMVPSGLTEIDAVFLLGLRITWYSNVTSCHRIKCLKRLKPHFVGLSKINIHAKEVPQHNIGGLKLVRK